MSATLFGMLIGAYLASGALYVAMGDSTPTVPMPQKCMQNCTPPVDTDDSDE